MILRFTCFSLALLLAPPPAVRADVRTSTEEPMDASALAHALDRVSHTARVLYVAAHPDDENTRLLAYLAGGRHVTAAYLSMTRGGGGQNLIGPEQDELLDSIRTHELLAARALDGAIQKFSRTRDFGYSKSAGETLALWGHDASLADVVLVIRTFQPDVIVTRFDEKPPNHGHHTASAILAREAFSAAADPKQFPEQIKAGLTPWQATRLVHNVPHWRDPLKDPLPKDAFSIDVGTYDTRLGLSYGELAARSRSQHKSQGFGIAGERGELLERFVPVAGRPARSDLLEAVELGWTRFGKAAEPLVSALADARKNLHRDHPERAVPALVAAYAALDALGDSPRVRDARHALSEIIAAASGLFIRASAQRAAVAPGSEIEIGIEALVRKTTTASLRAARFPDGSTLAPNAALGAKPLKLTHKLRVAKETPVSMPHWLAARHGIDAPLETRAEPIGPPPLALELELEVAGRRVRLSRPVLYSWTDRVHGERLRPVQVMPPATITPARNAVMLVNGGAGSVALRVRASEGAVEGQVDLGLPAGWSSTPQAHAVKLGSAGDETVVSFSVKAPAGAGRIDSAPGITVSGTRFALREDVIDYAHVPLQVVVQPSRVRLQPLRLQKPAGVIGYIAGSGDSIASDLAHVGLSIETLDDRALESADLGRYAAILLGVRAYNTRTALRSAHARLMKYVERGGTVVVQYNTHSGMAPLTVPIGPYPIALGRGRVTDETARMTPVDAKHALLARPNRIADADFADWVQERGLYFAETWDARYTPLLELADPDEPAQRGALLVARHGRGRYVYTGLSFFRQLPAGVPGAYRMLANLLAK
jgi:LmbE family N-acetylglucosaminyl deacetylase